MAILLLAFCVFFALLYLGRGYWAWVLASALTFPALYSFGVDCSLLDSAAIVVGLPVVVFGIPRLRRTVIARPLMKLVGSAIPAMGKTEEIALKAGSVWWEGELFSGTPDWQKLLNFAIQPLSASEQRFLDGPTEKLCEMLNDWQITQKRDLGPETWDYIKNNNFFGMVIPKKYGGLGFSAAAHSAVITKIASRSVPAAVVVMVPNSLGPGELLHKYGTQEQKDYYLPRLAKGEEIPCFALTETKAGSDAASGLSQGIVCEDDWQGKKVVGIRLTFRKRYITLAPIATLIGLSFRLYDPDHLLGELDDIGITCALIPRDIDGIRIGNRHDPMGVPFPVGPVAGEGVFIPLAFIIGGRENAGHGWRMLMETLSTGRGISLPSLAVGAAELTCRATGAYAIIREQFGLSIGHFEGIRDRLARIAGYTYLMNAARKLTCGAVDAGESPSVVSAISKAYLTEGMRVVLNDGMDIWAGSAICRGPLNLFSAPYISIPIGITVEGANVLTRSLIIFGQGVIRCHPYLLKEIEAVGNGDSEAFDRALFGHINYAARNATRILGISLFGSLLNDSPVKGPEAAHYKNLNRLSMLFAFLAEVGLVTMGGKIKRKEYMSGRYADALAWMYLASAVLKSYRESKDRNTEKPLLDWAMAHATYEAENALLGIIDNLPNRFVAGLARNISFPFGARQKKPADRQIEAVASALLDQTSGVRERLSNDIFIPTNQDSGLGMIEAALSSLVAAQPARKKLEKARRQKKITKQSITAMVKKVLVPEIISEPEYDKLLAAEKTRDIIIQVADFDNKTYGELK
jgi:acyl-CoA dehydrogenase